MTELKDAVKAILTDLIEARHQANKYSQAISNDYAREGVLSHFSTPAVDIGNVKLDIKFCLDMKTDSTTSTPTIDRATIDKIIRSQVKSTLSSASLPLKEASGTSANKAALERNITKVISRNIDSNTLKINRNASLTGTKELLAPHLANTSSGRPVAPRTLNSQLNTLLINTSNELIKAKQALAGLETVIPKMLVDAKSLQAIPSELVGSISLDLDLYSLDWHELEDE
ncbi:hypothetical protein ACPV4B_12985 [Vibrio parahaemolyticus]|uniref:hypothetical protein n=1 Tax=Vibrio mediterranei TaxID=689 RepID=UPI0040694A86